MIVALVAACGGSGSDGGAETGTESVDQLRGVEGFDVAAAEGTAWVLTYGEPAEVWQVAPDGSLTRHAELDGGGDTIAAFGDGVAVTQFTCTDPDDDDECSSPVAELALVDEDGSIDHELTLAQSDAGGLQAVGMEVVGSSDEHVWVEVSVGETELFAVSRSGDVETVPLDRRPFAQDGLCVLDGELLMMRVHTDQYDPDVGPPASGVVIGGDTSIRTTVSFDAYEEGEWRPVPGTERTFELRGDEAMAICDRSAIRVESAHLDPVHTRLARWTPDGGWAEMEAAAPEQPGPPGHVGIYSCADCVWANDGSILQRGDDGTFRPTGLVVADPRGAGGAPGAIEVDIGPDGAMVACAEFPADPSPSTEPSTPPTVTVTAAAFAPPAAQQGDPLVCDRVPD